MDLTLLQFQFAYSPHPTASESSHVRDRHKGTPHFYFVHQGRTTVAKLSSVKKEFSNYDKWTWDIVHQGAKVHLVFRDRYNYLQCAQVEVTWTTTKFNAVKFNFNVQYDWRKSGPNWKEVFRKLRISLSYGLNQSAREVTDRLMSVDPAKPHPIHNMVRTSRSL